MYNVTHSFSGCRMHQFTFIAYYHIQPSNRGYITVSQGLLEGSVCIRLMLSKLLLKSEGPPRNGFRSHFMENIPLPKQLSRRRQWHPTPVLLPGKSHGWRSLVGCSPRVREESDSTEWLHFHFSLSCIGEGNGNTLQCSCLENPRGGGAWWADVNGVAQSLTRLKWLSSSSSSYPFRN